MNNIKTTLRWMLLLGITALLFPSMLSGQTAAVSGNLQNLGAIAITSSNTYVEFKLRNYGSSLPRISGTAVVVSKTQRFNPDGSGDISGNIYRNDNITPDGTFYRVCVFDNGRRFRCNDYTIAASTFDLTSATPNTTPPVVTAPTGDDTYQRLDGGNNATGNYVPNASGLNLGAGGATWDLFAGTVGIGTASPTVPLHVVGTAALFDSTTDADFTFTIDCGSSVEQDCILVFADRGSDSYQIQKSNDGDFDIFQTGVTRSAFEIKSTGNITIRPTAAAKNIFFRDDADNVLMTVADGGPVGNVTVSGTLTVDGVMQSAGDDEILLGDGTTMQNAAMPNCVLETRLRYTIATNIFACSSNYSAQFISTCSGVATSSTTILLFPWGNNGTLTCTHTATTSRPVISRGGTLRNLRVRAVTAGVNASSGVVTLYDDGSATSLTCTIGTSTVCNDAINQPVVGTGSLVSIRVTTQAAETLAGISVTWEMTQGI